MEQLSDIAKRRLNQHKLGEVSQASLILFTAQKFLQDHFGQDPQVAKPLSLRQGTLWIGVKNSVYAQEVQGLSQKLLATLQVYGIARPQRIRTKHLTPILAPLNRSQAE